MPDLSSADLALANLESPLAPVLPASDSTYNLCASSVQADLLSAWGFDLLSLANNHSLDCSPDGPARTISALDAAGIAAIGPGMEPVYREVNGLQLAFLAFDDVSSPLDENAAVQAIRSAHAYRCAGDRLGPLGGGIPGRRIRPAGISCAGNLPGRAPRWSGDTTRTCSSPLPGLDRSQPARFQTFARCTLVLYSLGNALFDQGGLDDTRQSALVVVTLDADGVESAFAACHLRLMSSTAAWLRPDAATAEKIQERLNLP